MKLAQGFVLHRVGDTDMIVPVGDGTFSGVIRLNKTGGEIAAMLADGTTEEAVVDALFAKYDAPRETIAANVAGILDKLRSVGALDE